MIMFTTNDLYPQGYLFLSLIGGLIILIGLLIKSKEDTIFPKYYWFPILFIPVSSFFLLYMLLTKTALNEIEYISIILCFILNFIAFIFLYSQITNLIQKKIEQQIEIEQNNSYKTQISMMTKSLEKTKEFQHDIKNILIAVSNSQRNHIAEQNFKDLLMQYQITNPPVQSGNTMIDSIIQYKLLENQHLNIKFHANAMVPEILNGNMLDIGIIIGNLLDNALEAISQIENRWINLDITYSKGRLLIHICNPYSGNVLYHNNKISTTKKNASNHGLGLKRIDSIVKKYDGLMEINHENQQFTVKIIMYIE